MFIPRVKCEKMSGCTAICAQVSVYYGGKEEKRLSAVLGEFTPYLSFFVAEAAEDADLVVRIDAEISDRAEYYELTSHGGRVTVVATDFRGLVGAAATLSQMIIEKDGALLLLDGDITDYPDKGFRGFMVDVGRKYIPMDEFRAQILMVAKSKMNKLHLHLLDTQGCSVDFDSYKLIPSPDARGRKYSKDDLRALVAYAAIFDIDVIPEMDMPGHSFNLTRAYPEMRCDADNPNGWAACISTEATYDYARTILTEVAEIFPYEYLHVGTDEIDMKDIISSRYNAHQVQDWERCRRCNEFFGKMGLHTTTERFYYFLRRVYDIVKSLGKKMMMWNDNIDISVSPDLPRDILIHFWRVAAPMRGPREGCSMQRFLDEGFEVVCSDYPNTYANAEYMEWERLKAWNVDREPADAGDLSHLILGPVMCAWENPPNLKHSIYTAVPAFADRAYDLRPIDDEPAFDLALSRFVLGPSLPEGVDLFGKHLYAPLMFDNERSPIVEGAEEEFGALLDSLRLLSEYEKHAIAAYKRWL